MTQGTRSLLYMCTLTRSLTNLYMYTRGPLSACVHVHVHVCVCVCVCVTYTPDTTLKMFGGTIDE